MDSILPLSTDSRAGTTWGQISGLRTPEVASATDGFCETQIVDALDRILSATFRPRRQYELSRVSVRPAA
ncbi:hypothetical protein GCM10027569_44150 [Flindersiella endophytica]